MEFLRLVWRTLHVTEHDPRHSLSVCTTVVTMTASDQRRRLRVLQAVAKLRQAANTQASTDTPVPP